jgi:hypothetical protein
LPINNQGTEKNKIGMSIFMLETATTKKTPNSQILNRVVASVLLLFLGSFVICASLVGFFPETFGPIFSDFFSLEEDGIYADCSLAANKKNRICSGLLHKSDKSQSWAALQRSKKMLPFNLHDGK